MTEGDGGQSLPLAWLPDVLRHCAKTLPDKVAAQLIAQKLETRNGIALFELQRGDWARRVTDERVWIAGKPAQAAGFVYSRSNGNQQLPRKWVSSSEASHLRTWRDAEPERTEVRGAAGAVSLMVALALIVNPVDQLIRNPVFCLAILATDAAELFGYGEAPAGQPKANVSQVDAKAPESAPQTDEADTLPKRRRQAVDMLRDLESRKTTGARKKVADKFGISLRTVGKWIDVVNEEKKAAQGSTVFSAAACAICSN